MRASALLYFLACLLACIIGSLYFASTVSAASRDAQLSHQLATALATPSPLMSDAARAIIDASYRKRDYQPLWLHDNGLIERAHELIEVIAHAGEEGLDPADYALAAIDRHSKQLAQTRTPELLVQLELLLSVALYRYSNHQYSGRLAPADVDNSWHIENRRLDTGKWFEQLAARESIATLMQSLLPQHAAYKRLRAQLQTYRQIERQGGWPLIPTGPALTSGMRHVQVKPLRQRLAVTGDLATHDCCENDYYDAALEIAVKRFQRRHGLIADGRVGKNTRTALNVPVAEKIALIRLNMERWRWMPRDLGKRHLLVNMSAYTLALVENNSTVLHMPVVVGRVRRATPSFSGWVSYLEFNPYWTIPTKLAVEDFAPKQMRNSAYLASRNIKVFRGWAEPQEIDPQTIRWDSVDKQTFPYWLRQEPGPHNALGSIKFMFSNPYKIYLHGTPSTQLFQRAERALSSGCVRVSEPVRLAAYLLDDTGARLHDEAAVQSRIKHGSNEHVPVPTPVPIYLAYMTAWAEEDGTMNFRRDIYQRDERLKQLFNPGTSYWN
jgi:murein L,D-transpeptidase YcbB/YkuD